jgi:hypothetical protein
MSLTSRLLKLWITGLIAAAALAGGARSAQAYPQFQFSSGTNRCGQCHYSPSGGGLLTSWGRDESGDTLSLGGDGAFLHGLVSPPSWLAVGGDLRYAFLSNDVGSPAGPDVAHFPMQGDLYGRVALGESWSVNVTLGARGIVRPQDGSTAALFTTALDRFMSREHYIMWRPSATGPYARAGRFFAPYGLRFADHVFYVRRYTGFNLYQETYNASGGYVADEWEAHATLFAPVPPGMPDPLAAIGPREYGLAAYGEMRFAKMSALGAQMRIAVGSLQSKYQGGIVGKAWVEQAKLLFLGEANLIRQQFSDASYGQNQLVSYLGLSFFPTRGLVTSIAYERFHENLKVSRTGRNAYDFQVSFFPWAHCEVMFLGRYQVDGAGGADGGSGTLGMLQLHYYL